MPDVICMGEFLVEFVATDKNESIDKVAHWQGALPGGAPANVAVAITKLGALSSAFVGCVGKDPFGKKLEQALSSVGVDTSFMFYDETDVRTTMVFTAVYDDGHKELCFYRGADRCLKNETISSNMFNKARCFHYGSITLIDPPGSQAQSQAIAMARDKGLFITYDPNYRSTLWPDEGMAHRVMFEALQYAHMVKISEEEFSIVTGKDELQAGIQTVLGRGVELLIISRGENGALATNGDILVESPAVNVHIVETTGAGDAFMAAMISRMLPEFEKRGTLTHLAKETLQSALDYANVVSGLTCTKAGAIPALPTAKEVEHFLASRRQRQKAEVRLSPQDLAKMIDHTMLKPYCVKPKDMDIEKLCREAREYGFGMVAVNPAQVELCCRLLQDTEVCVGAAIGFPLGQTTTAVKAYETRDALNRGASEIDMVLNVRELQSGNYDIVQTEIEQVVGICREFSENNSSGSVIICKVILETCYLTTEEKVKACEICRDAGVDFVKTSTGFGPAGATVEDVELMRQTVGDAVGVKASGGIRDLATSKAMIDAGATRIGTSNGVAIMEELFKEQTEAD